MRPDVAAVRDALVAAWFQPTFDARAVARLQVRLERLVRSQRSPLSG